MLITFFKTIVSETNSFDSCKAFKKNYLDSFIFKLHLHFKFSLFKFFSIRTRVGDNFKWILIFFFNFKIDFFFGGARGVCVNHLISQQLCKSTP